MPSDLEARIERLQPDMQLAAVEADSQQLIHEEVHHAADLLGRVLVRREYVEEQRNLFRKRRN